MGSAGDLCAKPQHAGRARRFSAARGATGGAPDRAAFHSRRLSRRRPVGARAAGQETAHCLRSHDEPRRRHGSAVERAPPRACRVDGAARQDLRPHVSTPEGSAHRHTRRIDGRRDGALLPRAHGHGGPNRLMTMEDYLFENPWWLAALLILPLMMWLRRRQPVFALLVPFAGAWWKPTLLVQPALLPALLMSLGLIVLALALARPQKLETYNDPRQAGHELMLAIDLSGSMLAEDFERGGERINRLEVIKPVIEAFINDRPSDRIGLVVFAGRAYTLAPPTFDHEWLGRLVERLRVNLMSSEDGTAIGDGIGAALSRMEHTKTMADGTAAPPQKGFIVLLSDGGNNKGLLKPLQSAAIAKSRGITIRSEEHTS